LDGVLRPTAVAQDGKLVALVGSSGTTTTVVLATPSKGEVRRWQFDSVLVPEAFSNAFQEGGDGLPIGVFVIEYLAEHTYRVRVIDTTSGELGLPLNLRDKSQTVDEVMTAVSRTAVFEPNNQLLFTLYQDATEGGENVGSFIHTLGLFNGVWCLDVPRNLGLADHPGALAVTPDGSRLFAASSTGGVAGFAVSDITTFGPDMPEARQTAALGTSAARVAVGASNNEVVVALGDSLYRLDPATLTVRDSFTWDMDVEALTALDDGSIVMVGTGRMTMVSPDDRIMAERVLPEGMTAVTRVAAVGERWGGSVGSGASGAPVAASSTTTGDKKPSTELNFSRFSPAFSGSSSVSTTMISPARNSLYRIFSLSTSSIIRWMARRNGRAPSCGS